MSSPRILPLVAVLLLTGCIAEHSPGGPAQDRPAPDETAFDGDAGAIEVASTAAALTIPGPEADTTLRAAVPFGNDGTGILLGVTSVGPFDLERSLIKFRQLDIVNAVGGQAL